MMDTTDDPTTPSKLHIQYDHSNFRVMVDSGSSTSLVREQMAKDIEAEIATSGGVERQTPSN